MEKRACEGCSIRKIRCGGNAPCRNCIKAGYPCSFAKRRQKPGPKGPRLATRERITARLDSIQERTGSSAQTPHYISHCDATACSGPTPSPTHLALSPSKSNPPPADWERRFTRNDVFMYLNIYHQHMFPVWPVIDTERLIAVIESHTENPEMLALTFAVCASTATRLRPDPTSSLTDSVAILPYDGPSLLAERFAAEAERYRSMYDYRESTTVGGVLIPLFLHFYYGTKRLRKQTTTLLLHESVAFCQLNGLHKEEMYCGMHPDEENHKRSIFWLLYLTERGHAIQEGASVSLENSVRPPSKDFLNQPIHSQRLEAFHSLIHLFTSVDAILTPRCNCIGPHDRTQSRDMLADIQGQLHTQTLWPPGWNELQRSDLALTQQWLRILIWQHSLRTIQMPGSSSEESMSLTYPARVAMDTMRFISTTTLDALVAHGPGMKVKLFEIANTVIDVINCVPTMPEAELSQARDLVHCLCSSLAMLGGTDAHGLELLKQRLGGTKMSFAPSPQADAVFNDVWEEHIHGATMMRRLDEEVPAPLADGVAMPCTSFPF
ncbi:hypothetical protein BJX99DRAFT_67265 [Aspergillus californicus]